MRRLIPLVMWAAAVALAVLVVATAGGWPGALEGSRDRAAAKLAERGTEFADGAAREVAIAARTEPAAIGRTVLWWVALGGCALFAGLALSARWWAGPAAAAAAGGAAGRRVSVWFWLGLGFVLLVAAGLRLPRMNLSLYNDEAHTFRRYSEGAFKLERPAPGELAGAAELEFRRAGWDRTLWANQIGNNSVLFSASARVTHGVWRSFRGASDGVVNEFAFRLPSLLAGLAGVAVAGVWASVLVGPWAGVLAAALLAVHPWHIRFSTEGRGYSLVMLFTMLVAVALAAALRGNRWRAWAGFAVCEALLLASFAGAAYFLVLANLVALGWCVFARETSGPGARFPRYLVASLLAAWGYLALCAPAASQIPMALAHSVGLADVIDRGWWLDLAGLAGAGAPWNSANPGSGLDVSVASRTGIPAMVTWLWFAVLAAGSVAGVAVLARSGRSATALLVLAAVAAAPLAGAVTAASGGYLHLWYTIGAVPCLFVLASCGIAGRGRRRPWNQGAAGLAVVLAACTFTPAVAVNLDHPKEDVRTTVTLARGDVYDRFDPTAAVVAGMWTDATIYDPFLIPLDDLDHLGELAGLARDHGVPLFVLYSRIGLARSHHQPVLERLEDPQEFEALTHLPGLTEPQYDHFVYKMLP